MSITLVNVHLTWLNWFNFVVLVVGPLVVLINCHLFLLSILEVRRMSMSTVSSLPYLSSEIIYMKNVLAHNLNGLKHRVNIHILSLGSCQTPSRNSFHLLLLFLESPCQVKAMEWIPFKNKKEAKQMEATNNFDTF